MGDRYLYQLAERVGEGLRVAGWRIATAESCTGGWIAKALTDVAGSSRWLECGYVTYSNAAKMRDLGVSARTLQIHGAVSEATVREMAEGARRVSGAELAVAVSGIAGPEGGTAQKPVGTVWFALAAPQREVICELCRFEGDRDQVRCQCVAHALGLVQRVLAPAGVGRRLFFALWPDEPMREALAHAVREAVRSSGGRAVSSSDLHLTLAFLGSVPEGRVAELAGAARAVGLPQPGAVEVRLDHLEHWAGPQVLCAAPNAPPAAAAELAQALRAQLSAGGFSPDIKPFRAHVTVARKVTHPGPSLQMQPVSWHFGSFALIESRTLESGPVYSVVEVYAL